MGELTLGVVGTSRKPDERRMPIHPAHVGQVDAGLRARMFLERGYGARFGVSDAQLEAHVAGLRDREQLLAECDVVLLPKPLPPDLAELRPGQVVWGWPHCVQDAEITQLAIDRRLTLIAWEAMNYWTPEGAFTGHVFEKNNELAGYCSVLHALELLGSTGCYGRPLRAAVISYGATGRGAVTSLTALGIDDMALLTQREVSEVRSPAASVRMVQFQRDPDRDGRPVALTLPEATPLAQGLAAYDVIVNCILQDTDDPIMFITNDELELFRPGTLIVDVSCDEGMGFEWARPTSFAEPMVVVGEGVSYYAVDHSPSHLWNSATWEISEALIPYLPAVMAGPDGWQSNETVHRAIEIREGVVQNPAILSFQNRAAEYPHARL